MVLSVGMIGCERSDEWTCLLGNIADNGDMNVICVELGAITYEMKLQDVMVAEIRSSHVAKMRSSHVAELVKLRLRFADFRTDKSWLHPIVVWYAPRAKFDLISKYIDPYWGPTHHKSIKWAYLMCCVLWTGRVEGEDSLALISIHPYHGIGESVHGYRNDGDHHHCHNNNNWVNSVRGPGVLAERQCTPIEVGSSPGALNGHRRRRRWTQRVWVIKKIW